MGVARACRCDGEVYAWEFVVFLTHDSITDMAKRRISQQMDDRDSGLTDKVLALAYKAASCSIVKIGVMLRCCGLTEPRSPCMIIIPCIKAIAMECVPGSEDDYVGDCGSRF